jgi:hypothetical protein
MAYTSRPKGRATMAASCAFRILEAATISMAFVSCAVLVMDFMRRRRS